MKYTKLENDANAYGFDRRSFLRLSMMAGAGTMLSSCGEKPAGETPAPRAVAAPDPAPNPPAASVPGRDMARFPEKAEMILLTDSPPQLETPLHYFRQDLTPNEAFFVRWHLSNIPLRVDTKTFQLSISGHLKNPLSLSLHELRTEFEPVSLVAVNQCSGNSRSLYQPRVPGGQWGNGAIGNARWTGVRLKDLLERAGIKPGAAEVSFQGLDRAPFPGIAPFVKSLSAEHAMDNEVMIAYAMNGAPLPMLNGFPMRLVVPGWFATYWIKALNEITVLPDKFHGFWMDKAYRIPKNADAQESPEHLATETEPISRMPVRSLFVRPEPNEHIVLGTTYEVEGLALDSGRGIRQVEISTDGGKSWADAKLDPDLGKYSWRRWRFSWKPLSRGTQTLMSRATNSAGETQTNAQWNRSGYSRNVIESIELDVS